VERGGRKNGEEGSPWGTDQAVRLEERWARKEGGGREGEGHDRQRGKGKGVGGVKGRRAMGVGGREIVGRRGVMQVRESVARKESEEVD